MLIRSRISLRNILEETKLTVQTKKPDQENPSTLRAVDFFCGIGGMTKGFEEKGIDVKYGIDIDETCKETYESMNEATFLERDLTNWDISALERDLGIERDDDQMVFIGCSPCQYWSKINTNKEKSEDKAFLLDSFKKYVDYYNPGFIVIENVPGLKSNAEESRLEFLDYLRESDYTFDDGKKKLVKYGVPQKRIRYLLLASRLQDNIQLPEGSDENSVNVEDFIGEDKGFSKLEAGEQDDEDPLHKASDLSTKNEKRLEMLKKPGWDRFNLSDSERKEFSTPYQEKNPDEFRDVYARMWWNEPAPTITTRFNSFSNGRFGHPDENRALSLREGAVLQTFDMSDNFLSESITTITRQIGNAFPPNAAESLAECLNDFST